MSDKKSSLSIGRKLLLGVAVGALPLAGCAPTPTEPSSGEVVTVTAREKALYDQARADLSAETVVRFLSAYPESDLIPFLLSRVSGSELGRIPGSVVDGIDDGVKDRLPRRVKRELGLTAPIPVVQSDSSDGYSG